MNFTQPTLEENLLAEAIRDEEEWLQVLWTDAENPANARADLDEDAALELELRTEQLRFRLQELQEQRARHAIVYDTLMREHEERKQAMKAWFDRAGPWLYEAIQPQLDCFGTLPPAHHAELLAIREQYGGPHEVNHSL